MCGCAGRDECRGRRASGRVVRTTRLWRTRGVCCWAPQQVDAGPAALSLHY